MSILLQLQNGQKSFADKTLFDDGNFFIAEGEHIGVIGPNGAGKTTLFKILAQMIELDSGTITTGKNLRMAYLQQEEHFSTDLSVEEYLQDSTTLPIWEIKKLAKGLGITEDLYDKTITSLSGGYRMRCKLLNLLGREPNLLLLDEPTNYLDLESLLVLEKFLYDFKGAFLLISHDREFLRQTTNHILEIEMGNFTKFKGNIDKYFEQKALLQEQLTQQHLSQSAKRKEIEDFANKFRAKASKAKQVKSRLKQLDRMEDVKLSASQANAKIQIPEPDRSGKNSFTATDVTLGYPEKMVLEKVSLHIQRGDHIGVVGVNGAGKSTLLKAIAGKLTPLAGQCEWGHNVRIGYYAQHVAEELDLDHDVQQALTESAAPTITRQEILDLAGSLLFSGDDVHKKVKVLSGGEKSRVALGKILLQKVPFLILDEPTNHLDFDTVEALTTALEKFPGTIITVSHDRSFIGRVSTKVIEIRNGRAELYLGNYEEYLWSLQNGSLKDVIESTSNSNASSSSRGKDNKQKNKTTGKSVNYKEQRKKLERSIRQTQKEVDRLGQEVEELNSLLAVKNKELIELNAGDAMNAVQELSLIQEKIQTSEDSWLTEQENLEKYQAELEELIG